MPDFTIIQPSTTAEAIDLILAATPSVDSASTRLLFELPSIERLVERGERRAELIWAAVSRNGALLGLVGGRAMLDDRCSLIDLIALPSDPDVADALIAPATAWAHTLGDPAVAFYAPASESPSTTPDVAPIVEAFSRHGWQLLVERRQYDFEPPAGIAAGVDAPWRMEQAVDGDRDRLVALLQGILPGSLDAHDRVAIEAGGIDAAVGIQADYLLAADPIECIWFAGDETGDVAMVSGILMPDGRGIVLQVGVAESHRGRGIARAITAWMTRKLVAEGATRLIASTDDGNWPMARAFASIGWEQSDSRIDLAPVRPEAS